MSQAVYSSMTDGLNDMRNTMRAPCLAQSNDAHLEREINFAHGSLVAARDILGQRAAWQELCRLIKARSPEAVARLERERGLAPQ